MPLIASIVTAVAFVAAGLLIVAGAGKIVRPLPTTRAMYAAGLPGQTWLTRGIGLCEIGVGTWFLLAPSGLAGLGLAALYLVFAAFIGFLLVARPDASSCGCAGGGDVPPNLIHLVLDTLAAAAALASALDPPSSLVRTLADLGPASLPFVLGLLTVAALSVAAVTELPPALASYRRPAGHPVEKDRDRHRRADAALSAASVGPGHPSLWPGTSAAEATQSRTHPLETSPDV